MSNESFQILQKVLKKVYQEWFRDWAETATPSEKTGLQILSFILETRGLVKADKKIRELEPDVKQLYFSKFE